MECMTVYELILKLRKPIYVYTMNQHNTAPGSDKRCRNAVKDIDKLVREYVASWPVYE